MKQNVAYFGVFVALAMIFSYLERLIPLHVGIPGAKLGLANLVVVIALYKRNFKEALMISVVRVVLVGLTFGNAFSIVYGLAGGILSLCVMALLKRQDRFSIVGVSAVGGVCHNLGQVMIAMVIVETFHLIFYFPVLMIVGVLTGLLIGIMSERIVKRLRI